MGMVTGLKRLTEDHLEELKRGEVDLSSYLFEGEDESNETYLDKSWHAIHFLLNGNAWESKSLETSVILGGTEVSDEDVGYGPARYFNVEETQKISKYLSEISGESLVKGFSAMAANPDIYPNFQDSQEDREYITEYFEVLKKFVEKASISKNCLIVYMS